MTRQDLTLEKQDHAFRKAPRYTTRPDVDVTVEVLHIVATKGIKYNIRWEGRIKGSSNETARAILSIHHPLPEIGAHSFVRDSRRRESGSYRVTR
jgi:hypothetical protein